MANQPGCALLKTIDFPSPSSYHIPMSHQLVVEFHAHLSLIGWDFLHWLEFMKLSFIISRSLWAHMCNYPVVSRRQFSLRHLNLWNVFSVLFITKSRELWEEDCDMYIQFILCSPLSFILFTLTSEGHSVHSGKQKILWSGLRYSLFCQ